jgi:hypothetical protein
MSDNNMKYGGRSDIVRTILGRANGIANKIKLTCRAYLSLNQLRDIEIIFD